MKTDSVNSVCKKMNDDLMNENSFDDYISSSLYIEDFEEKELIAKNVLRINERSIENLNSEEKFQVKKIALKVWS